MGKFLSRKTEDIQSIIHVVIGATRKNEAGRVDGESCACACLKGGVSDCRRKS